MDLDLLRHQHLLRRRIHANQHQIFDLCRRKWVGETPEELVRQLLVLHFIHDAAYPQEKIAIEKSIPVHGTQRRFDIVIYTSSFTPWLVVECKRPEVSLDLTVQQQILAYHHQLQCPYLLLTNGMKTVIYHFEHSTQSFHLLTSLPEYHPHELV